MEVVPLAASAQKDPTRAIICPKPNDVVQGSARATRAKVKVRKTNLPILMSHHPSPLRWGRGIRNPSSSSLYPRWDRCTSVETLAPSLPLLAPNFPRHPPNPAPHFSPTSYHT